MNQHEHNPLHAAYYPDRAVQETVEIAENVHLARDTYRVRFYSPVIASRILPGQFVMLRLTGANDPLIGRPLALYDTVLAKDFPRRSIPASATVNDPDIDFLEDDLGPVAVDVVYLVKGKLTSRLYAMQPGQRLDVWGPLGNGFEGAPSLTPRHSSLAHLILVAGGIGYTPFLALAQEALGKKQYGHPPRGVPPARRVTLCYGARSADYLAGVRDFERLGVDIRLATDDGSRGHHGLVTELLRQVLAEGVAHPHIVCCGPEPMMEAAAHIAREHGASCEVSLETPMACGIGICFTCVAKVKQPDGIWDYKRTCVEGPVFDADQIEW
jgi:dihydroorotate dehydrogenase electron transfer subunit